MACQAATCLSSLFFARVSNSTSPARAIGSEILVSLVRMALLADRGHEAAGGQDLPPLPRRQLGRRDDECLDLGRVGPEAMHGVVVGPLDAAEQTV